MNTYYFRVNDSKGNTYRMEVKASDFMTARDRAMDNCYRMGLCFMGRI